MSTPNSAVEYLSRMASTVRLCRCGTPLRPFDLAHCPPCGRALGGQMVMSGSADMTAAWWVRAGKGGD